MDRRPPAGTTAVPLLFTQSDSFVAALKQLGASLVGLGGSGCTRIWVYGTVFDQEKTVPYTQAPFSRA
jgi:hypothetical protein